MAGCLIHTWRRVLRNSDVVTQKASPSVSNLYLRTNINFYSFVYFHFSTLFSVLFWNASFCYFSLLAVLALILYRVMIILGYALASVWLLLFFFSVSELLFKHSLYLSRKVIDCIVITWVGFSSIPQTIQPTTSPCQAQPQPPTAVLQSKTSPYTTTLTHVLKTDKNVFVVSAIFSQPGWTVSYILWIYIMYLSSKEPIQSILEMARQKFEGDWTFCLSHSQKTNQIFLLPV